MAIKVETLYVDIEVDSSGANKGIAALGNVSKKAESSISGLAKSLIGANLASRAITASARATLKFFKDSEKAASDAEETLSKFNVVYSDIAFTSNRVAKQLQEDFDLAGSAAENLLGNTGDLLTGFGFTQEAALDMSEQVARLGLDLASFTNYAGGSEGAVEALTKALLGETEQAKGLGIVIRQNSVEFRNSVAAIMAATGANEQQAKAQAILQIATEQSKNAIGDYERTSDSAANTTKRLAAAYETLSIEVGKSVSGALTPLKSVLADILTNMSEAIAMGNAYRDAQKSLKDGTITAEQELVLLDAQIELLTTNLKKYEGQAGAAARQMVQGTTQALATLTREKEELQEVVAIERRRASRNAATIKSEVDAAEEKRQRTADYLEYLAKRAIAEEAYNKQVNAANINERAEEAERIEQARAWNEEREAMRDAAHEAEMQRVKDEQAAKKQLALTTLNSMSNALGAIGNLYQSLSDAEIQGTEEGSEARKKALKKQAIGAKSFALFQAAINTAAAILEAAPNPWAIAFAALIGATQTAAIAAAPIPSFATGTAQSGYVVPPGYEGDNFPVSAKSGERETVSNGGSGDMVQVVVMLDSSVLASTTTRLIRDRKIIIKTEDVA